MSLWKQMKKDPKKYLKGAGFFVLALFVLSIGSEFLDTNSFSRISDGRLNILSSSKSSPSIAYQEADYFAGDAELSVRNVAQLSAPYDPTPIAGLDAEEFEYTSYSISYEKNSAEATCEAIQALKPREDVIFSSSSEYDRGCNYQFKVKNESADSVLALLESLKPEDLSENTQTIKDRLDDFTSEEDILKAKQKQIDETLTNAIAAYDEISALATETRDAQSLADIITSKINLIERLTQEQIRISEQLDRLSRAKAEQLDRLDFTTFSVNVYENKYIDGELIKDSWKNSVKEAVANLNGILQALSINLLVLFFLLAQYFLYILILVWVAKYGWELVKKIWMK